MKNGSIKSYYLSDEAVAKLNEIGIRVGRNKSDTLDRLLRAISPKTATRIIKRYQLEELNNESNI